MISRTQNIPLSKFINYIFAFTGLLMIGFAFWSYGQSQNLLATGIRTPGVVIDNIQQTTSNKRGASTTMHAKVEFTMPDGQKTQFISTTGTNPPLYNIGQQVEVIYPKDSPAKAEINDAWSLWGLPIGLGVLGTIFLVIDVFSIIALTQREKTMAALNTESLKPHL